MALSKLAPYHAAMRAERKAITVSRRSLLVAGGVGVGLLVAWGIWPRSYRPSLRIAPGEALFNAFLKIGRDGRVTVAVPQAELGQGVYTALPQILADELGADWRTVAVAPAPISPLYANLFLAEAAADAALPSALQGIGRWAAREYATRSALMLTGGSTSVRAFEARLREAGAAARALLSMAAADRWDADWETLDTAQGFVTNGTEKIPFAELAEAAAEYDVPENLPVRGGDENRLTGQPLPRLDLPAKVDGSAQFAGDIRLPDMVYASVRQGPIGDSRLVRFDRAAADKVAGVLAIVEQPGWVAAVATNWWAANRGLIACAPIFKTRGQAADSAAVDAALDAALASEGTRLYGVGDVAAAYSGGEVFRVRYRAAPAPNAPVETLTATARITGDRVEVWAPTQVPGFARAAAARAAGVAEGLVTLYPMLVGGGYGRKLETQAIEQAVIIARTVKRPVQLVWSRTEETIQDTFRPPAHATLTARLNVNGAILGWQSQIAIPSAGAQLAERLAPDAFSGFTESLAAAVDGAIPPYAIAAVAIDHHPAEVPLRLGLSRGGAQGVTAFFTESFIDELARRAKIEPLSFRMQMLGQNPRLARVLSTAAALGGWDGGAPGSNMGIAAHSAFGSHVATLLEVAVDRGQRIRVRRAVAAVDCGRTVNPDIVRQQIEGGIMAGIATATGTPIAFARGMPDIRGFGGMGLPRLAETPEVTVEIIDSQEPPGGVTELGVPTVAPAIANAIFASTGQRLRSLPLVIGGR